MLNFTNPDGSKVRPGFSSPEHMNEFMVERWNGVVRPQDKVYHLGDVGMTKKSLEVVGRLNGKKSLVMGNHDIFDASIYLKWFKNVRAIKVFDSHVFTHMPVHTGSIERFKGNVHGHVHCRSLEDPRYFNASVEVINYTPIAWEDLKKLWAH